jgi:RNA polymerase sigma factor for flagellar operon FliA
LFLCLRKERKDLLHQAVDELPQKERQVLSLYYFDEMTMKEIGVILGVGESRVSQIHSAALTRLRARLADFLELRTERTHPPAGERRPWVRECPSS